MASKGLYIVFHEFAAYSGITKKIAAQVTAFEKCGMNMELCYHDYDNDQNSIIKVNDKDIANFGKGFASKLSKRFSYTAIYNYIENNRIDFIYLRSYNNANPFLVDFAARLKKDKRICVLEIPTYPYDDEFKEARRSDRIKLYLDKLYRNLLASKLAYIITYTDLPSIFGQKTICISNGVDFDEISMKKKYRDDFESVVHLLIVAELHYWHGVDRAISGMANYYNTKPKTKVILHIVGKPYTPAGLKLQEQVKNLKLEEFVLFHGPLWGEALDDIFELADIGIGSLGRHRSNIYKIKTLKNREYAARGIPFVYSETDEDLDKMPYVLKVPADESALNISDVLYFRQHIHLSPSQIRNSIITTLSWQVQMKKIIDQCFLDT